MKYLINAFSFNMLDMHQVQINAKQITLEDFVCAVPEHESCIGHDQLTTLLNSQYKTNIETNRVNVTLKPGDYFLLVQYKGPRLPEGCTQLPEGAELEFWIGTVEFWSRP